MTQNPDGHASKGDEKHERTVQRRVCGFGQRTNCGWVHSPPGMAAAYEPTPKGALALHLTGPLGKGRCDTVVCFRRGRPLRGQACGTDAASSQRPGLWKPLAPHALRAGFMRLHPVRGAFFYGKTYSFDALSLTARSSFDSFDASCL